MRVFVVPAKYQRHIMSALALAVADVGRDVKRQREGHPPTIRPTLVDPDATGDLVIMLAIPNVDQQAKDLDWPGDGPNVIPITSAIHP